MTLTNALVNSATAGTPAAQKRVLTRAGLDHEIGSSRLPLVGPSGCGK